MKRNLLQRRVASSRLRKHFILYQSRNIRRCIMTATHSDSLVFFGITGDLAYKQIFPALQAMIRRGHLDMPIVAVAKAGWDLDKLRARVRDSLTHHGGVDEAAFARLCAKLSYIDGDYHDAATFTGVRAALGKLERPLHYL